MTEKKIMILIGIIVLPVAVGLTALAATLEQLFFCADGTPETNSAEQQLYSF